ncbi:MAG: type II toxin-antitoxin system prevent-host-death family antitoxin [Acidobacteria bacterium]|nr:type II toxin-antitoxin system prevent-host-death family antitoxin [Acidobacteriota bacterium]HMU33259.1 type II toxin-antitoxin system prevent-host-death family antitoxin [Pyrinomonadaceae bacterium]
MKSLPVGELKAQFSEVLEKVQQGETIEIVYGKKKKPVARLVPISDNKSKSKKKKRKLGILDGKMKVVYSDDFKMTDEELINLKI